VLAVEELPEVPVCSVEEAHREALSSNKMVFKQRSSTCLARDKRPAQDAAAKK
jgi:hypothetical protein